MQQADQVVGNRTALMSATLEESYRNAAILFCICLPGFLFNAFSSYILLHHRAFKNPFGKLVAAHTVSNAILVFIMLTWATPAIILKIESNIYIDMNRRVGQLAIFFQECAYHMSLFISFNRFMAIGMPIKSRIFFTNKATNIIIIATGCGCAMMSSIYFIPGCNFSFNAITDIWEFENTFCGNVLAFIDLFYNVFIFSLNCVFDMITLFLLKGANERILGTMQLSSKEEIMKRQRREILFFSQALTNTFVYCFMLISFHVISTFFDDRLYVVLSTTMVWALAHSAGGFIVIIFNVEIRNLLFFCRTNKLTQTNMRTVCNTIPTATSTF